jgi:hypothetical protein
MKIHDLDWKRGLTRLYLIVLVFWFLYWFIWVPFESANEMRETAIAIEDDAQGLKLYMEANFVAQFREVIREMRESPFGSALFLLAPPLLGYAVLRLALVMIRWILRGFLISKSA